MKKEYNESPQYTEGSLSDRFDAWVRETLDNLIRTEVRTVAREKRRRREVFVDDISAYASYDPFDEEEEMEVFIGNTPLYFTDPKVVKALRKLSPRRQQVIEGSILLAIPIGLLAEELNLKEQTVKNYKHDAIQFLRNLLEG